MNFKKFPKYFLLFLLSLFIIFIGYFYIGKIKPAEDIKWGVVFAQRHSEDLGLDWKENYSALFDDLGVKNLRIVTYWNLIEQERGRYDFEDLDWQIKEADKKGASIILTIGMKTGRWPECHIPDWANNLSREEQQESILRLIEKIVLRYRAESSIWSWQVENEPFFAFGECPWRDKKFLKKEIDLVKILDQQAGPSFPEKNLGGQARPVIISDAGELSLWLQAAKFGDILGTTMYRKIWSPQLNSYFYYWPFSSTFYWRKTQIIKKFFNKKVICVELQAEPWGPKLLYDLPLEEQEKTMNLERFKNNIEFAKKTGLDEFYLWGSEWWFWLKEKQNKPEIWLEARKLF